MASGLEQDFAAFDISRIDKLCGSDVFGPHLPEVLGKLLVSSKNLGYHVIVFSDQSTKGRFSNHYVAGIADRPEDFLHRIQKQRLFIGHAAF